MKRILDKVGRKPKRKLTPRAEQMRQDLLRIYRIKLKIGTNVFEAISEYQKDLIRSGGSVGMMLNLASELQIEKKQLTK